MIQFSLSFTFNLRSAGMSKTTRWKGILLSIKNGSRLLSWIGWTVCTSKFLWILCVSFFRVYSDLCIPTSKIVKLRLALHKCSSFTTNDNNNKHRRKGMLQILGHIGSEHYQTSGDKRNNSKKYFQRSRKPFETKLYSRNLIKWINT